MIPWIYFILDEINSRFSSLFSPSVPSPCTCSTWARLSITALPIRKIPDETPTMINPANAMTKAPTSTPFQNLFFSSRLSMLLSSQRLYRPPKPEVIHPLEGHGQITLMFPMLAVLYVFPAAAAAFFVPRFRSMHARKNLPVKSSFMENAAIPRCPNKLRQPGTDGISK